MRQFESRQEDSQTPGVPMTASQAACAKAAYVKAASAPAGPPSSAPAGPASSAPAGPSSSAPAGAASSGLCKRIIPCLDVANGRTVKGVRFNNLRDMGDPAELALLYEKQGADEIMFLDITASSENRATTIDAMSRVAEMLSIPFSVGGGVSSIGDASRLLEGGADKVAVNTAAVRTPALIAEIASRYGSQCCVLAIDARRIAGDARRIAGDARRMAGDALAAHATSRPTDFSHTKFEVLVKGGREATGIDALSWARQAVELGAGEILLTSWNNDGTLEGFDLSLVKCFAEALAVPVIASGGAGGPQCFVDVFNRASADAALAASIFHNGTWTVRSLKEQISLAGVNVRLC